jgi:hypothetical protein
LHKIFLSAYDIQNTAHQFGFITHVCTPERFHFSKSEHDGYELHIDSPSVLFVIWELVDYCESNGVLETYSFQDLEQLCKERDDIKIAINQTGQGWIMYLRGQPGQYLATRFTNLRALAKELSFQISQLPYGNPQDTD